MDPSHLTLRIAAFKELVVPGAPSEQLSVRESGRCLAAAQATNVWSGARMTEGMYLMVHAYMWHAYGRPCDVDRNGQTRFRGFRLETPRACASWRSAG